LFAAAWRNNKQHSSCQHWAALARLQTQGSLNKNVFHLQPMALAISSALTCMGSPVYAQVFDPNSAAVRQAYVGDATPQKVGALLNGLIKIVPPLPIRHPTICACDTTSNFLPVSISYTFLGPSIGSFPTGAVTKDSDLGFPGAPVSLNFGDYTQPLLALPGVLDIGASFATPRDFFIGPGGGYINTNGQDLTILGRITAQGTLQKSGQGSLSLTSSNVWNGHTILIAEGVLRGNANSLNSPIFTNGSNSSFQPPWVLLEFSQTVDAVHAQPIYGGGAFVKTGPGTLTLTAQNDIQGGTRIEQGILALAGAGTLSNSAARSNVLINAAATLDLSAADGNREIGTLSGNGNLKLGKFLLTGGEADSSFGGVISGVGGLGKDGRGLFTLTSAQTYTGVTSVVSGTFALAGAGRINSLSALLVNGVLDISAADGDRSAGSLSGSGKVRIGANNLIVGHDNSNTSFQGAIEGRGGFIKTGSGTLTLFGLSDFPHFFRVYAQARYEGATVIESGTLVSGVSGISSHVINRGTLGLIQERLSIGTSLYESSDIGIYSGSISGIGNLVKFGDGIIWLRGRNTYSGGTEVKDGVLIGNTDSLQGNVTNNAALAFYQVDNGTYAGILSVSGTLLQFGPGVLTLTGNNT
jgi:fibronectin-binding autotransporter adhesin